MIDTEVLVDLMKSVMTKEQLRQFVEKNSEANLNGCCLLCGEEDIPVDEQGHRTEDGEEPYEFQESHTEGCPITRIEALLVGEGAK